MAPIDSPGNRLLSRRAALRLAGAAALTLPAMPLLAAPLPNTIRVFSSSARQFDARDDPFTLGVAAGAPRPDGFVLWTRLAPLSEMPLGGDREVGYEIAEEPAFRRVVQRGLARAEAAFAHAVHLEARGLQPGRPYLVPLLPRPLGQRDRSCNHRAGARQRHRRTALRLLLLRQLPARLFRGLSPSGGGRAGPRAVPRRLHLRIGRPLAGRDPAAQRRAGGNDPRALSQPLCAVPPRSRPAAPACRRQLPRHLGRPRGAGRLCRPLVGRPGPAGGLPEAPRRRLPGVLRAHAAARPVAARPAMACGSTPRSIGATCCASTCSMAGNTARAAPAMARARAAAMSRRCKAAPSSPTPRAPCSATRRSSGSQRGLAASPRALERDRAGRADGAHAGHPARRPARRLDRGLGRLSGGAHGAC